LDTGLDAVVMAHGRLLHRRHANAHSPFSHADAGANSTSHTDADAHTNAESRPGM
jgi:hypothetical protein